MGFMALHLCNALAVCPVQIFYESIRLGLPQLKIGARTGETRENGVFTKKVHVEL